jgi:aminopeptidase N
MFQKTTIVLFCIALVYSSYSQSFVYNPVIDVLHYEFNLKVTDDNDTLSGTAFITVKFLQKTKSVSFDLVSLTPEGRGMVVTEVKKMANTGVGLQDGTVVTPTKRITGRMVNTPLTVAEIPLNFTHSDNKLMLQLTTGTFVGEIQKFEIKYAGIPADGLIFSKNKFGHRTIFGDNWPNRARNWLPCVDHLSDKTSVDFIVTAPDHYQVVANGLQQQRLTHWKEAVPIPTKVMVIGLADFAVNYLGDINRIPLSSWVFPEEKNKGFYDYGQAAEILPFYIKKIGPYSYEKLANIQSKTIYGGMENASAIFYNERSITGKRRYSEELLAHEIAHQWFGDAVTEADWPHIWLSEGFATEMTNLYLENKYGKDTLTSRLKKDRDSVIAFSHRSFTPVVDTTEKENLITLLNHNSYEKGGWVLHMLRRQLGDVVFWKGIRLYYATYRGKNASTGDLQHIFEKVSGKNLNTFFRQWLYTAGNPELQVTWSYSKSAKSLRLTVTQLQTERIFSLPLEIGIRSATGLTLFKTLQLDRKVTMVTIPYNSRPAGIRLDPHCNTLFEGSVEEKRE